MIVVHNITITKMYQTYMYIMTEHRGKSLFSKSRFLRLVPSMFNVSFEK
jgi:hypothetical protein